MDKFLEDYLILSRNSTKATYRKHEDIEEGSIVAFQVTTDAFHPSFSK